MTGYDRDNTNLNYEDIINLPHPVSKRHKPMPVEDRAAQFAPFAALTGHRQQSRRRQELQICVWNWMKR